MLLFSCGKNQTSPSGETASFPPDSVSADGKMSFHGMRIDESGAIPAEELKAYMLAGGKPEVKVAGTISACCQAKGCWMTMPLDEETEMRIRFKDYGFFIPKDAAGKTAIAEGRVFTDTLSVEELRHLAVDGGMSEEAAAAEITQPEVTLAFEASGVIIKE